MLVTLVGEFFCSSPVLVAAKRRFSCSRAASSDTACRSPTSAAASKDAYNVARIRWRFSSRPLLSSCTSFSKVSPGFKAWMASWLLTCSGTCPLRQCRQTASGEQLNRSPICRREAPRANKSSIRARSSCLQIEQRLVLIRLAISLYLGSGAVWRLRSPTAALDCAEAAVRFLGAATHHYSVTAALFGPPRPGADLDVVGCRPGRLDQRHRQCSLMFSAKI